MKSDWEQEKLSDRFYGCVNRLVQYLDEGKLPQYFNPENNLLEGKDGIADDAPVIKAFLRYPPQLPA